MLNAIREFFESHIDGPAARGDERHTIEVATAALLAELSAYEQHTIRKIADLLYVPHRAYIAAKLRARDAARE